MTKMNIYLFIPLAIERLMFIVFMQRNEE